MTNITRRTMISVAGSALALAACGEQAASAPPSITFKNPWMRLPPGGRDISAAYLEIHNTGGADTLVSVSSPMAKDVQMHIHEADGDVMSMRREQSVAIAAQSIVHYQPMGRHLMVFGLSDELGEGDEISFTLQFERSGVLEVIAIVGTPPAHH